MTHWGWYWRVKKQHIPKALCEEYPCLDSFKFFKNKKLVGFTVSSKRFIANAAFEGDKFVVTVGEQSYIILVEKQACHFGGYRYFIRCPAPGCNRRYRKLYCHQGFLLCRKCLNLGYYTQRVTPSLRYKNMLEKIEKRLKEKGGSIYKRPKWMRKHTFEHLTGKLWEYEIFCEKAFLKETAALFGPKFWKSYLEQ